jgi:hypothetical protein
MSFAQSAPSRLINFVIKYTGGTTDYQGLGYWDFNNTLSPLAQYRSDIALPLGLNTLFLAPMNSHASPQVSALSGAMTGFQLFETYYPLGNLKNYSTGGGKSIDVLIGEKLQAQYKTPLPYLLITDNEESHLACTHRTSSWGANGEVVHSISSIGTLQAEIKNKIVCEKYSAAVYKTRLQALELIKSNHHIFSSNFLIDHEKFDSLTQNLQTRVAQYDSNLKNLESNKSVPCSSFSTVAEIYRSAYSSSAFNQKMDKMYDLAITALEQNITRVLTVNLYMERTHGTSHYSTVNPVQDYLDASQFMQSSIAQFMNKLKQKGLYNDSLVFCNAGSCMSTDVHNYENLSTYVINAGVQGIRGSAANKKPVGSLLLDILHKFGITYSEYGGTDHSLGVAKKGGFV